MPIINPKDLIFEARRLEAAGFLLESARIFDEALAVLIMMINSSSNIAKKAGYMQKLNSLKNYKDELKERSLPSCRHSYTLKIDEGSTDFSYEKIFGEFLDESVKEMHITDTYMFNADQVENLICFLELVVKKCKNLRYVCLFTRKSLPFGNKSTSEYQKNINLKMRLSVFHRLIKEFRARNIIFRYRFIRKHYRCIDLSNGTTFVLDTGLDIYQKLDKFSLGHFDYNLRKCKDTMVHILQTQPTMINNENLI